MRAYPWLDQTYRLKHPPGDDVTLFVLDLIEFMPHIHGLHPFGAATGCANRQSCCPRPARRLRLMASRSSHLIPPHLRSELQALPPHHHSYGSSKSRETPPEHRAIERHHRTPITPSPGRLPCDENDGLTASVPSLAPPMCLNICEPEFTFSA